MFQRVPTGVPELDDVIEGGLPKAGLFLVARTRGSGKTAFSAKFPHQGIVNGEKRIYVSFAESRDAFDYYGVSRPEKDWESQIELVQVS